jgi:Spy/CpxP family protein refolding chaperone
MKKVMFALVCLVVLGFEVAPLFAHSPLGRGGRFGEGGPGILSPFLLQKLNLTADQQANLQQIMDSHKPTLQALFQQLRTGHQALSDTFFAPGKLAVEDLSSQTDQISKARQALMNEGLAVALEIRNLLTPAQLAQAAQLQQQMKALHEQMRDLMEGNP